MASNGRGRTLSWDRLRVFLTVAEEGSFTQAGRRLDLSQSAVSRQINALETSLSVSLFHRHARGLMLTEQGEDLLDTVKEMNSLLGMGLARINESSQQPQGPLRITTTVAFGSAWLTSRMNVFHRLFPAWPPWLCRTEMWLPQACRDGRDRAPHPKDGEPPTVPLSEAG